MSELTLWDYIIGAVIYCAFLFWLLDLADRKGWGLWD